MPITTQSRYSGVAIFDLEHSDGSLRATVAIRPSTAISSGTSLYRHVITGVENVEYLAWRFYGSSDAWWRIAEANPLAFPLDIKPGSAVAIPTPDDMGRVVRTRRF